MSLSENIFLFFQGKWQLNRSINGHGSMKGMACFMCSQEDPLALFYREEGEYITENGGVFSFFREYLYCLNHSYLDVYFANGKKRSDLFHRLTFSETTKGCCLAKGEHSCDKDIYRATYQFLGPNEFILEYDIHGPKKNLKIQTSFQRKNVFKQPFSDDSNLSRYKRQE